MKKLIIFLLCVGIIGGGGWYGYGKYKADKEEKKVVDVVPVELMAQPSEWFEYYGSDMMGQVLASNAQKVYIDTEKLVKKVCVEKGQTVKKGDTILEYDMTVVELELAQKENQVKVIEQEIKMANKELEEIKKYKPSEDAPKEPDYPDFPDYPDIDIPEFPDDPESEENSSIPDIPDEPQEPEIKIIPETVIKPAFTPAWGTGSREDPFIIYCSKSALITQPFMVRMATERKFAELCVYDDELNFLYKWIIDPEDIFVVYTSEWFVNEGIILDEASGAVSLDPDIEMNGKLSFVPPVDPNKTGEDGSSISDELPDDSSLSEFSEEEEPYDDTDTDMDIPDYSGYYNNYDNNINNEENNDYIYSKAQIQRMISEKEGEIKQKEIDLKTANFEYETSKKRRSDGKVVANIDGIVKKIGKASDEAENDASEKDIYEEPSEDDNAFAVIEGEGGMEVVCEISELNLSKAKTGSIINVMSWETGNSGEAEITEIETEPSSYNAQSWGENPNNSSYLVHARLLDAEDFNIGDWLSVTIPTDTSDETQSGGSSVYMPIHYVRQEGGDYYIMKADENGRLKKQYIKAGQIMYGRFIEVKGGLSMSDRICFPYGNDVKEGVRTHETTEVLEAEY